MEIIFLGTSAMVPTKERNHSAVLITYKTEGILIDCGEGTQRQMKIAGIKPSKVSIILISHWHGDHVLGLPGLIQTMANGEYDKKLMIYGPKGTKEHFDNMNKAFIPENTLNMGVEEISSGRFLENNDFYLESFQLKHGLPCLGYNLVEKDRLRIMLDKIKKLGMKEGPLLGKLQQGKSVKWKDATIKPEDVTYVVNGKKISFIADTVLCDECIQLAKDADLLICEATYASDLEEKAHEYKHLTAKQAGLIANKAGCQKLVLTHFSQRYKNTQEIEEDARSVFDNVVSAYDLMRIRL